LIAYLHGGLPGICLVEDLNDLTNIPSILGRPMLPVAWCSDEDIPDQHDDAKFWRK
jgi:hypothetical protein